MTVLILSAYDDENYVRAAMAAGVSGYLLKTMPSDELIRSILAACEGTGLAATSVPPAQGEKAGKPTSESAPCPDLTAREQEVVRLVARGMTNKAIAHQLGISPRTVEGPSQSRIREARNLLPNRARPLCAGEQSVRQGGRPGRRLRPMTGQRDPREQLSDTTFRRHCRNDVRSQGPRDRSSSSSPPPADRATNRGQHRRYAVDKLSLLAVCRSSFWHWP